MNRRRLVRLLPVVMAAVGTLLGATGVPARATGTGCGTEPRGVDGTWTCAWYPAAGVSGGREYWVYAPPNAGPGLPVLVYLHGCTQDAVEGAYETGFDSLSYRQSLAGQGGFDVVYPQQTVTPDSSAPLADGNGAACWNWFLPGDQVSGQGEPATIAGITRTVVTRYTADSSRVYVEGVSAGADMAVIMGAAYPKLYAAVGAVAGCPYATCSDSTGALAYHAMGADARQVPVFVEQGTADTLNAYPLGAALAQQWLGSDDWADDGADNGSVSRLPSVTDEFGFDQTPAPGSGDPCVRNSNFPCAGGVVGFQGGYPYTVQKWTDSRGCDLVDMWSIHGLEHAYPHAPKDATFGDPLGPDVTSAAYGFFSAHPMGACAPAGRTPG